MRNPITGKRVIRPELKAAQQRRYRARLHTDPAKWAKYKAVVAKRHPKLRADKRASRLAEKLAVIAAYGGDCACCHEADDRFLTIDHINGGGRKHRQEVCKGRTGIEFYKWLRRQGYPPGFQVLCFQCNCGRNINGGICPHKDPR